MVRTEFDIVNREHDEATGAKKVKIVDGNVTINASDIEIGAVELKNSTTDDRAKINPDGTLDVNIANATKDYFTNDLDDYTTANVTYIGKEKKDGTWFIMKIDETNGTVEMTIKTDRIERSLYMLYILNTDLIINFSTFL